MRNITGGLLDILFWETRLRKPIYKHKDCKQLKLFPYTSIKSHTGHSWLKLSITIVWCIIFLSELYVWLYVEITCKYGHVSSPNKNLHKNHCEHHRGWAALSVSKNRIEKHTVAKIQIKIVIHFNRLIIEDLGKGWGKERELFYQPHHSQGTACYPHHMLPWFCLCLALRS